MPSTLHVYILASYSRALYTGVTNDLVRRVQQHRDHLDGKAFTAQYNVRRLVYYESTDDAMTAITREKQIKAWRREKRVALIERHNPGWVDLAAAWPDIAPLPRPPR